MASTRFAFNLVFPIKTVSCLVLSFEIKPKVGLVSQGNQEIIFANNENGLSLS